MGGCTMDENPSLLISSLPVFLDRDEEAKAERGCS